MRPAISEEEKVELRKNFDLFDDAKTGHIHSNRLGLLVRGCGENPTEAQVNEWVSKANAKGGTVSFEEFFAIMQDMRANEKRLTVTDVEAAFRVFDPSKSGKIHTDELRKVLTTLGEKLSEEEVNDFLGLVETGGDGRIDYRELAKKLVP